MKNFISILVLFFLITACNSVTKENEMGEIKEAQKRSYITGADRDVHGCVGSAGYSWSIIKKDCVRFFEIGYRLNPVVKTSDAVHSAFVIFNDAKDKVEIALPNLEKSFILELTAENIYSNSIYSFNANLFTLEINDVIKYKAAENKLEDISNSLDQN